VPQVPSTLCAICGPGALLKVRFYKVERCGKVLASERASAPWAIKKLHSSPALPKGARLDEARATIAASETDPGNLPVDA
jgi:hypothetical protein